MLEVNRKRKFKENKILFILLLIYLFFRLPKLTLLPIFNDEAIYLDWGWREINSPGMLFYSLYDAKPPLLMWIFAISQKIFSNPLFAGRIISVFTGLLSACGIYLIAKKIFSEKIAVTSFLIYTITPIFAFFDRQALMESSIAAVGVWSLYFFVNLKKTEQKKYAIFLGLTLSIGLFIKSNALIFIVEIFLLSILLLIKQSQKREVIFNNTLLVFIVSAIILLPLYLQAEFWKTLSLTSRFSLSLQEISKFPVSVWLKNITNSFEIMFWHLNPLLLFVGIIGIIQMLKSGKYYHKLIIFWLLIALTLTNFLARNITSRYLVSFLPFICVIASYQINLFFNKNLFLGSLFLIPLFIFSIFFTALLLFSPLHYFNYLNNLTKFSQKNEYVTNWTSGYGVKEAVDYLKNQSEKNPIYIGVQVEIGNPESSMFTYFAKSKKIQPTYLDSRLFKKDLASEKCLESNVPIYFVSRDNNYAGLDNLLTPIKRFEKPEGEHYIEIHKVKTCDSKNSLLPK